MMERQTGRTVLGFADERSDMSAEAFEWYADWCEGVGAELYARLARGVAGDPELLELVRDRPSGQPTPQLLFAAVHDRLLAGADHRIAGHYPTCSGAPRGDPFPAFREFCLTNADAVRKLVATRRVQTNAVGRSAVLYPAFARVARGADEPLHLVEIGASAGLNLRWDHYRYSYDGRTVGDPDSEVHVETAVRGGDPSLPSTAPRVGSRVGVDLHPLDPDDPGDARWLRALVPPEHAERFARLDAALRAAAADPPRVVAGDALDLLPELLEGVPASGTRCVFSTHTLYQFDDADRDALRELLVAASADRPVHWLANEVGADCEGMAYRHVELDGGVETERRVATYGSYGAWLAWLA